MSARRLSFAPGPAMLPAEVVTAFQSAVTTYSGTGLGILELGHRSTEFTTLMDDTISRVRQLVEIPDTHEVLFLHGGARMQFAMLPANLLPPDRAADYLDSGHFARAAGDEAENYGQVHNITGASTQYRQLPNLRTHYCEPGPAYVHYTSNNTEVGTQYRIQPAAPPGSWLACDASSDLLTRPFDVGSHGVIYATAHKNLGTAGLAVVIIDRSLLVPVRPLPSYFSYETHAQSQSCFNTPPVVSIFTLNLMLRWVTDTGGVAEMTRRSQTKAAMIYGNWSGCLGLPGFSVGELGECVDGGDVVFVGGGEVAAEGGEVLGAGEGSHSAGYFLA
jgi:phosphoserine aminotransferase